MSTNFGVRERAIFSILFLTAFLGLYTNSVEAAGLKRLMDTYVSTSPVPATKASDGIACTAASDCSSNYCYPGPDKKYCLNAGKNCAQPGTSGVLFGTTYAWNSAQYSCVSGVGLKLVSNLTVSPSPLPAAKRGDGIACTVASDCSSNNCYPGPNKKYCLNAGKNCAQPGTSGVLYGASYTWNGSQYECISGVGIRKTSSCPSGTIKYGAICVDKNAPVISVRTFVIQDNSQHGNEKWTELYLQQMLNRATEYAQSKVFFRLESRKTIANSVVYQSLSQDLPLSLYAGNRSSGSITVIISNPGPTTTAGLSYIGANYSPYFVMRSRPNSDPNVELSETARIFLHELGHNIGYFHSGDSKNGGSNHTDNYFVGDSINVIDYSYAQLGSLVRYANDLLHQVAPATQFDQNPSYR